MNENDISARRRNGSSVDRSLNVVGAFSSLNLLGESSVFRDAMRLVHRLAPSEGTILLHGETGTGKELAARAIHYLSPRRDGPFVPVNCGAVPDSLVESEFFGHAQGAFTDARAAREGLIAQAFGGTLFLDELEALSPRGQVVLLRFLQDQEYRPIGGERTRAANVRVVGSTNVDLGALARRGTYREDLVYRLNVLAIEMPPLRKRGDDVTILARAFLDRLCRRYGSEAIRLHPEALAELRHRAWPGNIRELENLIHREFLLREGDELRLAGGTPMPAAEPTEAALTLRSFRDAKQRAITAFEREYLAELLARANGNITLAARLAGKERSRLGKLLRKHGLVRPMTRAPVTA